MADPNGLFGLFFYAYNLIENIGLLINRTFTNHWNILLASQSPQSTSTLAIENISPRNNEISTNQSQRDNELIQYPPIEDHNNRTVTNTQVIIDITPGPQLPRSQVTNKATKNGCCYIFDHSIIVYENYQFGERKSSTYFCCCKYFWFYKIDIISNDVVNDINHELNYHTRSETYNMVCFEIAYNNRYDIRDKDDTILDYLYKICNIYFITFISFILCITSINIGTYSEIQFTRTELLISNIVAVAVLTLLIFSVLCHLYKLLEFALKETEYFGRFILQHINRTYIYIGEYIVNTYYKGLDAVKSGINSIKNTIFSIPTNIYNLFNMPKNQNSNNQLEQHPTDGINQPVTESVNVDLIDLNNLNLEYQKFLRKKKQEEKIMYTLSVIWFIISLVDFTIAVIFRQNDVK